jgi:serine/threonine protein kinase
MTSVPKTLGKYQVLGAIGRGGMGEVYKAFQPDLNRHVAIKTLLSGEQATPEFLERFQREARVAAKLAHPNIVPIYDIGAEGKLHYIVMEHVEGRSLKELMSEKRLDPESALKIAHTVARTLQFAHERKIVHRDIKPANILLDRQGRVRILDFGLAKSMADGKALTLSSVMLGTPYYMSPEQAFGAPEEVDHRTDLYSLGAVLFEMLTGRPPFEGATVLAILRKLEDEDPAPAGISPAVDAVVAKALAKDRERRYAAAAEFAEAVKACLKGPVAEPEPPPPPRAATARASAPPPVLRVRRRFPFGVAAASAAAGALLLALVLRGSSKPPVPTPLPPPAPPPRVVVAPDLGAELRQLLSRKTELLNSELAKYREDPQLRRMIADHFRSRGQFTRALDDLRGYERAIVELGSARGLQRFASPALFRLSIAQPRDLKGPEAFLMAALARHLEGKQDAAREKLRAAEDNGALAAHVQLVRAHLDLWEAWPDPSSEPSRVLLGQLRARLEKTEDLSLLPLFAIASQLLGDSVTAWATADRLARLAPSATETFLLRAILFQRERIDLALDVLDDAADADRKNFDPTIQRAYYRMIEVLRDPENEKLAVDPESDKMDLKEMREALDDRLRHDHYPAALLLRAAVHALESRWEPAEEDLRKLAKRAPLDRITVDHDLLAPFAGARGSRTRLLDAACNLQSHLGRLDDARATAEQITGDDLGDDEKVEVLRWKHRRLAQFSIRNEAKALQHLEASLKLGTQPQELRDDGALGALRTRRSFMDLLKRYEP